MSINQWPIISKRYFGWPILITDPIFNISAVFWHKIFAAGIHHQGDMWQWLYGHKMALLTNVIQIRMTERELELRKVPVSFFVKKYQERG